MDYPTLPIGFHWAPLEGPDGSWVLHVVQRLREGVYGCVKV